MSKEAAAARAALALALKAARPDATFDDKGYTTTLEMNLLPGIPVAMIEAEYGNAAGGELKQKMRAPWSSSALVVNSFSPWRNAETTMQVAGIDGLPTTLKLEAKCPNGVARIPPHVDVLFDFGHAIVAVESKLIEYLVPKKQVPAQAYLTLEETGDPRASSQWFQVLQELHEFELLDAYQLVKHYLGLRLTYPTKPLTIVYLFWEPTNPDDSPIFGNHRAEITKFGELVGGDPTCEFRWQSYADHWTELGQIADPPHWLASHLDSLRARYAVSLESVLTSPTG
jgi:hypothetical protein